MWLKGLGLLQQSSVLLWTNHFSIGAKIRDCQKKLTIDSTFFFCKQQWLQHLRLTHVDELSELRPMQNLVLMPAVRAPNTLHVACPLHFQFLLMATFARADVFRPRQENAVTTISNLRGSLPAWLKTGIGKTLRWGRVGCVYSPKRIQAVAQSQTECIVHQFVADHSGQRPQHALARYCADRLSACGVCCHGARRPEACLAGRQNAVYGVQSDPVPTRHRGFLQRSSS